MIAVIEPVLGNTHHAAVNAGLLEALALARPDERIVFAATARHRQAVMEILGSEAARFGHREIAPPPSGSIRWGRILLQFRLLHHCLLALRPHTLICMSCTPETLFASRLLLAWMPHLRIIVVLHGILTDATGWRSRDPRHRLIDSRSALAMARHARLRLVVLEPSIRDEAVRLGLLQSERTDVWPHPIAESEVYATSGGLEGDRTKVAFLGGAKRSKGFGEFLRLMRLARQHCPDRYQFSLIGTMNEEFSADETAGLMLNREMLPRHDYIRRLREVHYVCMPLQSDTYTLTASGSLLDCIASATPLIATPTAAILNLASSGPVGFLANARTTLEDIILDPDRLSDRTSYARFQQTLVQLQAQRRPVALASAMRATLYNG